jgi:UDP-3-O-[3-hydroxymyristoyl] glucosamine N-acyltransferase
VSSPQELFDRLRELGCTDPRLAICLVYEQIQEFAAVRLPKLPAHVKVGTGMGCEWDDVRGRHIDFPQLGGIQVGRGIQWGLGVTVMHGSLTDTIIGDDCRIGNQCNIGHGSQIGRNCILTPGVRVGGSAELGERVFVGQGVLIKNKVKIGDGAVLGQGANVICDVPGGERWWGIPASKEGGRE